MLQTLLQVVDVYQQCAPSIWTAAANSPWKFLSYLPAGNGSGHAVPVPLQRRLLQVVATAQRLQVPCPENLTHTTAWSAVHLAPVLALLATVPDSSTAELCEETVHSTIVALGLHCGRDELVCHFKRSHSCFAPSCMPGMTAQLSACRCHCRRCAACAASTFCQACVMPELAASLVQMCAFVFSMPSWWLVYAVQN